MEDHGYLYDLLRKLGMSDFGAKTGEFLLVRPLKILLILAVAVVISRIASRAIRRSVMSVHRRSPLRPESVRAEQRAATVADVLGSLLRVLVYGLAGLVVLDELGVNLAPLIAGAGIAGVAIGFGAQTLVRDVLAGLFVLIEDQYGVGDVVTLGPAVGTVEDLDLRVTRVRAADGTVWFVPNGETRAVGNSSMEFSRAVVDIHVGRDDDYDAALSAISEEAAALHSDPAWGEALLEAPEVQGAHAAAADGVTVRVVAKTAPREQFDVARALRGRITRRLQADRGAAS